MATIKKTTTQKPLQDFFESDELFDFSEPVVKKKDEVKKVKSENSDDNDKDQDDDILDDDQDDTTEDFDFDDEDGDDSGDDDDSDSSDSDDEKKEKKKVESKKETVKKEDEEEDDDPAYYTVLATTLKEKGILTSVEVPKDKNLTEEEFIDLQEEEFSNRVDETVESFFKDLDQDAKEFIKFKRNGGNTINFLKVYSQPSFPEDLDLTKEANKNKVIKTYLTEIEGLEDDELEDRLEFLKDSARVDKYAIRYLKFFVEKEQTDKQKLIANQAKQKQDAIDNLKKFKEKVSSTLNSKEDFFGLTLTKKQKDELFDQITNANIKKNNRFKTKFQDNLDEALNDPIKMIAIAKILSDNFSFKDIKKKATTEKVQSIKDKLRTDNKGHKQASSTKVKTGKTLADLL